MSSTPAPDRQRAPFLSVSELRQALTELDSKIKTLHQRAGATAAGSPATYEQHAASLEAKRAKLAAQLDQAPAAAPEAEESVWDPLRRGVAALRDEVQKLL